MPNITSTVEKETSHFWKLMRLLAAAKLSGDADDLWEALDDLDVFTLHAEPSTARARAAREVARHGFVAKHVLAKV